MDMLSPVLPELDDEELPIYDLFWNISDHFRTFGFGGPDPLGPAISQYMDLMGQQLGLDMINLLLGMDKSFRDAYSKESDRRAESERSAKEAEREQRDADKRFG